MSASGGALDHIQLGLINQRNGWHAKAADCFRLAVEADPQLLAAQLLLISALLDAGQADPAASALDAVLADRKWDPSNDREAGQALTALGASFRALDRLADAARCFAAAAEVSPDDATAHQRLGIAQLLLNQPEGALAALDRSVALDPQSAETHHNRGVALTTLGREIEAIAAFSRALEINPEHVQARAQRMFIQAGENDWASLAEDLEWLPEMGTTKGVVSPFAMLSFEDHPERHKLRSMRYAAAQCPVVTPIPARPTAKPAKLRLGYFSADFRNHAMVHLAGRMFELHDRERFEIHAFAFGPPSVDVQRKRMIRAFDHFTDVDALSDEQIAAKARADGIDIAIDLLGYTKGDRAGIFARRAAPVQINYLGFPGTSGALFIDYLIADPVIIAPEYRACYTEKLITLPFTYQPTDNQTAISARRFTRQQQGLPEAGFVFCCFNQRYKIKPTEYVIWMRLLAEVEGSVLWLPAGSATSRDNLRAAAAGHGVDPDRLRFAEPLPVAEHLARIRLADLFVDCFHYNAHTTAMDALWVGLPLVTKIGSGFAARVAASLLGAVGLSELVTTSDADYCELALALARDPARLRSIRDRLAANRSTMPMFDSERYTRHIEAGYEAAYQRYFDGLAPADIRIDA